MESLSIEQREIIAETLQNILTAIAQLEDWNRNVKTADEWRLSSAGMRTLAANCMLIEAIGEAVKQIEKRAGLDWLNQCSGDMPWREIMAMRNHIAHGYFEIDADFVFSVIREDLAPLKLAVTELQTKI